MRHLTALLLIAATLPGWAAAADKKPKKGKAVVLPPPTAQLAVVGYRVVGPPLGTEGDSVRPFNWSTGVTLVVAAQVKAPYGLVALDKERSSIALTDSLGKALDSPEVDWSPDFTNDRTSAMVELEAKGLPGAEATSVSAKGSLMFTASTGIKTIKVPNLKLAAGTPFKLGTAPVTVGEIGDGYGSGPTVEFKGSKSALSIIKTLRAKDAKGAVVETSWSSSGGFNEEWAMSFTFKTEKDKLGAPFTLEFDVWDGLRDLSVPVDVKAGMGVVSVQ
jgi:hypothetical protein